MVMRSFKVVTKIFFLQHIDRVGEARSPNEPSDHFLCQSQYKYSFCLFICLFIFAFVRDIKGLKEKLVNLEDKVTR